MLFAGFWSLALVFAVFKLGFRDKENDNKVRKALIVSIALNVALWYGIYCLTNHLKEQEWMKNFDPLEVLGVTADATEKEIKKAY